MTPEQQAAIERLKAIQETAKQGNEEKQGEDFVFRLTLAISNEALPLIEALAAENERLRTDFDRVSTMLNLSTKSIETALKERDALQAENERLKAENQLLEKNLDLTIKDLIESNREIKRLNAYLENAVNKGCELESEIEKLKKD